MGSSHLPRPVIVRWPAQAELRRACAALDTPCLLVIDEGCSLPALAPNEDAVRSSDGERDAAARLALLARRPPSPPSSPGPAVRASAPMGAAPMSSERAVRRVVGLLQARPARLLSWLDLAPASTARAEVAVEAARLLDTAGWWVEVLDGVGILAGPTEERVS